MTRKKAEAVIDAEIVTPGFDYGALSNGAELRATAADIRQRSLRLAAEIQAIGAALLAAREALPHGRFGPWCAAEFDWDERTARRFMAVARTFKSDTVSDLKLPPTALYLLASPETPEDFREQVVAQAQQGERFTCAQLLALRQDWREGKTLDLSAGPKFRFEAAPPRSEPRQRIAGDIYPTPHGVIQELLPLVNISGRVFEPCAGPGAIAEVLREAGLTVHCGDIEPQIDSCVKFDATRPQDWEARAAQVEQLLDQEWGQDWVITNPPFNGAVEILAQAMCWSRRGVILLLPITFLEPVEARWEVLNTWADNLVRVIPVNPRPQFRGDSSSSDRVTVAWFVWDKDWSWYTKGIARPFTWIRRWR
jgi:hypothetical protein